MVTTRSTVRCSRRAALKAAGSVALGGIAGCLSAGKTRVRLLSAGSLAHTFENHVIPAFEAETGTEVYGEYYGANAVMRMVLDGTKHPDVIVSADATLLRDRLYPTVADWDIEFAANSLGLGYNPETPFGRALEAGTPWYELAVGAADGDLAIGDPNLDPLGYRAVQAFELAEAEYGLGGFRSTLLEKTYREPDEPQLMAGVETGSRAAAVVYRNMAVDYDMPFLEFPAEYNFAEPTLGAHYATAEYTTDREAYTAVGRPILYNATVSKTADNPEGGHQLVSFLGENADLLVDAGLTVGDTLPQPTGTIPEAISL